MGKVKKNSKKEELDIPVMIFCIIGVVLTVLGVMLLRSSKFKLNVLSTEATVTNVQTVKNAKGELVATTYVVSYTAVKDPYTANIMTDEKHENDDKITIYYDILSPANVSTKRTGYQGYLSLIIGLILVLKTGPKFYRILLDNYL